MRFCFLFVLNNDFFFRSCFGYVTDRNEQISSIAIIEASLNIGVIFGYVLCTFVFKYHVELWQILLVHVALLIVALIIAMIFLEHRTETKSIKIHRTFIDARDLLISLKKNSKLIPFFLLLSSLFFYEFYHLGSPSIIYLYLHRMSFDDTEYATYFTCEQTATSFGLLVLAFFKRRRKFNDVFICLSSLIVSSIGLFLFAFAQNNKSMIFGAIPSLMFGMYFPVSLRVLIRQLVPDNDKGSNRIETNRTKSFSSR